MGRMVCRCGQELSNSETPNDVQLRVYTDKEWDEIFKTDFIKAWEIPLPKGDVWRCTNCERLYVFYNGCNQADKVYVLEK